MRSGELLARLCLAATQTGVRAAVRTRPVKVSTRRRFPRAISTETAGLSSRRSPPRARTRTPASRSLFGSGPAPRILHRGHQEREMKTCASTFRSNAARRAAPGRSACGRRLCARVGLYGNRGRRGFALDRDGSRHVPEDAHDGSEVHRNALSVVRRRSDRAWLRARTRPAGWATVRSPSGSRATVGGRIKEPVLSPPSPCTGRRNGPTG